MSVKTQLFRKGAKTAVKETATEAGKHSLMGTAFSVGVPLYFGAKEYQNARNEGNGVFISGARAVGDFAVSEMMGGGIGGVAKYMALQAVPAIPKTALSVAENLNAMSRTMNRASVAGPFGTSAFNDNQQKYTMRQAGMQLAQASKYNLQQTLMGNEAQYMKY